MNKIIIILLCISLIIVGVATLIGSAPEEEYVGVNHYGETNGRCGGCCSHHGGVACGVNGKTICADGSPLSNTCQEKGCHINECSAATDSNIIVEDRDPLIDDICRWRTAEINGVENLHVFKNNINVTSAYGTDLMIFLDGQISDPDAYMEDHDCTNTEFEWGFRILAGVIIDHLWTPIDNYIPTVEVVIDGQTLECTVVGSQHRLSPFEGIVLIPIPFEPIPHDRYADPFETEFYRVTSMYFDGTEIDLSNRNY